MLVDITVDTNVLVHANNPQLPQSRCSLQLINLLLNASTELCVDPGFDLEQARNQSRIAGEYLLKLHHGMMGYTLIAEAASQHRVKPVSTSINAGDKHRLEVLGLQSVDKLLAIVSSNSEERILSTHDDQHFTEEVCGELNHRLGVSVLDACGAAALI
jgi:hypothetical protein